MGKTIALGDTVLCARRASGVVVSIIRHEDYTQVRVRFGDAFYREMYSLDQLEWHTNHWLVEE